VPAGAGVEVDLAGQVVDDLDAAQRPADRGGVLERRGDHLGAQLLGEGRLAAGDHPEPVLPSASSGRRPSRGSRLRR